MYFSVLVKIGNVFANALVDSASTTTFMTPEIAKQARCLTKYSKRQTIVVDDGSELWTEFTCRNCNYTIQDTSFTSDFRLLKLKCYGIILGVDWFYKHNPVV